MQDNYSCTQINIIFIALSQGHEQAYNKNYQAAYNSMKLGLEALSQDSIQLPPQVKECVEKEKQFASLIYQKMDEQRGNPSLRQQNGNSQNRNNVSNEIIVGASDNQNIQKIVSSLQTNVQKLNQDVQDLQQNNKIMQELIEKQQQQGEAVFVFQAFNFTIFSFVIECLLQQQQKQQSDLNFDTILNFISSIFGVASINYPIITLGVSLVQQLLSVVQKKISSEELKDKMKEFIGKVGLLTFLQFLAQQSLKYIGKVKKNTAIQNKKQVMALVEQHQKELYSIKNKFTDKKYWEKGIDLALTFLNQMALLLLQKKQIGLQDIDKLLEKTMGEFEEYYSC